MKPASLLLFAFVMILMCKPFTSKAQESGSIYVGFEFQAYPTGLIPGLRVEKSTGDKGVASLRLGYNWIRHRDLGVHDDERGDGYGFTLGYKYYFQAGRRGWHLGGRTDLWWNSIEWYDLLPNNDRVTGQTEITVVQPTAELGYTTSVGQAITFTPTLSFGWEWNVKTDGQPTGEGAIILLGFHLGHVF